MLVFSGQKWLKQNHGRERTFCPSRNAQHPKSATPLDGGANTGCDHKSTGAAAMGFVRVVRFVSANDDRMSPLFTCERSRPVEK